MKQFSGFVTERKGEKAHRQAVEMGLKYKGFGYWVNPTTGKVTHQTQNDELVPVEPDVESEKWGGDEPDHAANEKKPKPGMAVPGGMSASGMPALPSGGGQNLNLTGDAEAHRPVDKDGWEAGPHGDTCVNNKTPVPADTFVGKSNSMRWVAGPDGSNFTTKSFGSMRDGMDEYVELDYHDLSMMYLLEDDSLGLTGRTTMMKRIRGGQEMGQTERDVVSALDKRGTQTQRQELQNLSNAGAERFGGTKGARAQVAQRAAWALPQRLKDRDRVERMNNDLRTSDFFADPDYDLTAKGEELGSGAFGSVYEGADGKSVIKEGEIGREELKVLRMLRDVQGFPTLLNAQFTSPFVDQSSEKNNPIGFEDDKRKPGQSKYELDSEKFDSFDRMFPMAKGTFAMEKAKGRELADEWSYFTDEQRESVTKKIWALRAKMHKMGIVHNDMHSGNILVDEDGNPSILDFGLASNNPVKALMEALGGAQRQGGDYQFSHNVRNGHHDTMDKLIANKGKVQDALMEKLGISYDDDYEESGAIYEAIEDMMRGDIRMKDDRIEELTEQMSLGGGFAEKLIEMLYDGVEPQDLQTRMSQAYDKLMNQPNVKELRGINDYQKKYGKPVIPMKGLDWDD